MNGVDHWLSFVRWGTVSRLRSNRWRQRWFQWFYQRDRMTNKEKDRSLYPKTMNETANRSLSKELRRNPAMINRIPKTRTKKKRFSLLFFFSRSISSQRQVPAEIFLFLARLRKCSFGTWWGLDDVDVPMMIWITFIDFVLSSCKSSNRTDRFFFSPPQRPLVDRHDQSFFISPIV